MTHRLITNETASAAWDDAYALKHRQPRVVVVSPWYWLAALPAVMLCVALLVALPNPGGL